jgi:anti-anti-sigma regulatory factor
MSLRITKTFEGRDTIVRIDGWLRQENAGELEQACGLLEACLTLDLSGLRFADKDGVRIINHLVNCGAVLRGVSRCIQLLLAQPGD